MNTDSIWKLLTDVSWYLVKVGLPERFGEAFQEDMKSSEGIILPGLGKLAPGVVKNLIASLAKMPLQKLANKKNKDSRFSTHGLIIKEINALTEMLKSENNPIEPQLIAERYADFYRKIAAWRTKRHTKLAEIYNKIKKDELDLFLQDQPNNNQWVFAKKDVDSTLLQLKDLRSRLERKLKSPYLPQSILQHEEHIFSLLNLAQHEKEGWIKWFAQQRNLLQSKNQTVSQRIVQSVTGCIKTPCYTLLHVINERIKKLEAYQSKVNEAVKLEQKINKCDTLENRSAMAQLKQFRQMMNSLDELEEKIENYKQMKVGGRIEIIWLSIKAFFWSPSAREKLNAINVMEEIKNKAVDSVVDKIKTTKSTMQVSIEGLRLYLFKPKKVPNANFSTAIECYQPIVSSLRAEMTNQKNIITDAHQRLFRDAAREHATALPRVIDEALEKIPRCGIH